MALSILDGNQTATTLSTVLTSGEHIPAHTVVSLGSTAISNITSAVSGSVVSVSNLPSTQTIAGTVTVGGFSSVSVGNNSLLVGGSRGGVITPIPLDNGSGKLSSIANIQYYDAPSYIDVSPTNPLPIRGTVTVGNSVTIGSLPAISGTVTANAGNFGFDENEDLTLGGQKGILVGWYDDITGLYRRAGDAYPLPVGGNLDHSSGTYAGKVVPVQIIRTDDEVAGKEGAPLIVAFDSNSGSTTVTVSSLPAISGTVTANNPNGALTTRFGSVTTANTAQITSAVTNTNRKYLLAQNISAGTVTIGIGFSPTTTQGIQLTAGGGLTFDAFCPTGAVYWLGAVTGAAFTILEG